MQRSLLRLPQVIARVGLRRSSLYRRVAEGTFPAPIKLGARAVAWDSLSVDEWINSRLAEGGK
jgi:prophage regulatory protein